MNSLKKMADTIEEHPNTVSLVLGVAIVGIYCWFCKKMLKEMEQDLKSAPCITFTPKQ